MGRIITLTGPSGVGKTTLAGELIKRNSSFCMIRSITTRKSRPSDLPGEYMSVTYNVFDKYRQEGVLKGGDVSRFLWMTNVHGNAYGTLKSDIDEVLAGDGTGVMLLVPGVIPILQSHTDRVLSLYIYISSKNVIRERLLKRGENSEEEVERRIADCINWDEEARRNAHLYKFVSNDGEIDETVQTIMKRINDFFS